MELKNMIVDIRKKQGLSQEEMAAKLFVTRQAVSRWENGETTPNIDTLKMISQKFKVSPNLLLGLSEESFCQSCGMDMKVFDDFGTKENGDVHLEFCKYCFQKGSFTHQRTVDEMVELNLRFLDEYNQEKGLSYTPDEARIELKKHLLTLKRWK